MNVFPLEGLKHGGWYQGEEGGMAVKNVFSGVCQLVKLWWCIGDVPKFVCGGASGAGENGGTLVVNSAVGAGECCGAAGITELTDGEEVIVNGREEMGFKRRGR